MKINYNQQGENRKKMVTIISETIAQPLAYSGAPRFEYRIGDFTVERDGTLAFDSAATDLDEVRRVIEALKAAGFDYEGSDCLSIGFPREGFTDEGIANLEKLVASKAPLIKKALGVDDLPIEVGETELGFPWFRAGLDSGETYAFAQFITQLCKTAKEKKRVTAKAPEGDFENEKFTMRVWLIGLGMIGAEFGAVRKLLIKNLDGNSSWRYRKPEKAPTAEAPESEAQGDE
jgi:hypothetical protein